VDGELRIGDSFSHKVLSPQDRFLDGRSLGFDGDRFGTYQDLISLRRTHEALRRGSFGVVQADDERNLLTFARTHAADALLVTLNRSEAAHSAGVPLPDSLQQSYETLRTVPEGASVRVRQDGAALLLKVPGHTGVVLRATPQRGGAFGASALVCRKSTGNGYSFSGRAAILYAIRFWRLCVQSGSLLSGTVRGWPYSCTPSNPTQ